MEGAWRPRRTASWSGGTRSQASCEAKGRQMEAADRPSVLLVDDRAEKLLALEAVLSDLPLDLVRAHSGRDALRCILAQEFAVILLVVNMPGMDGFEAAQLIRQRKSSEHTPIIFVTAYSDEVF